MHEQAIAGQTVDLGPALEAELEALDREMPRIQSMAGNVFALASAWAERHAAIIIPRGRVLSDYHAYQRELTRLGGRVR